MDFDALRRDGFVHVPRLVDAARIRAASTAIEADLQHRYDPARQVEYDHRSYCPDIRAAEPIMALLLNDAVRGLVSSAIEWNSLEHSYAQIAIRRAHNAATPVSPVPHIDGVATEHNGVESPELKSFTALVGVLLTPQPRAYCGNFTVWPGSHNPLETHFRRRGKRALREGIPHIRLPTPVQLLGEPGDVILAHYQLMHSVSVNTSDQDRIAVFFRLSLNNIAERRWELLTHIWNGWRPESGD